MRRVTIDSAGGPEKLMVHTTADSPRPGPGQVLVDVEAAGVNYLDVYQRNGAAGVALPFTPGLEGVGRIRTLGDGAAVAAAGLSVGQRVAWIDVPGSYADQVLVPAERAIPVPDSFTIPQTLLFQAITAQYLIEEYRAVRSGDRVLVHSAAGGVGQILVQWLKHLGAWVVGLASNEAKVATVRALGADAAIVYGPDYAFLDALLILTEGRGVDLVFDAVGAATLPASLKGLSHGATLVSFGAASGRQAAIDPRDLIVPCTRIAGGSLFSYIADPAELRRRAAAVVDGIRSGWLRMGDGTAYALDRVADAHCALESRRTQGKVYLVV